MQTIPRIGCTHTLFATEWLDLRWSWELTCIWLGWCIRFRKFCLFDVLHTALCLLQVVARSKRCVSVFKTKRTVFSQTNTPSPDVEFRRGFKGEQNDVKWSQISVFGILSRMVVLQCRAHSFVYIFRHHGPGVKARNRGLLFSSILDLVTRDTANPTSIRFRHSGVAPPVFVSRKKIHPCQYYNRTHTA